MDIASTAVVEEGTWSALADTGARRGIAGIVVMRPIADVARARAVTHIEEMATEAEAVRKQRVVARPTAHPSVVLTVANRMAVANTSSS